ncbi:MAG: dicarboxylate/amino acid:cation symporter [Geminicoccaceae bacterium]
MQHAHPPKKSRLTLWIGLGVVLGIAVGFACNQLAGGPDEAKAVAANFTVVTDIFLRLIKMIIAPLVFATIVSGIASLGDAKTVGGIAFKAMGWFIIASVVSLSIGLVMANLLQPGAGLNLPMPTAVETGLKADAINFRDFITHVFPTSVVQAMAGNEVLQILVFSVFFGVAVGALPRELSAPLLKVIDAVASAMFNVTDYVMRTAPLGVFAAMAAVVTVQGIGVLADYGRFIGAFYLGLVVLWTVLIGAGWAILGGEVWRLLKLLREPMLLAFSTASSEAALPKTIEQLDAFGVRERISGFVLPLGYSFNLDGSMMYQAFAALFIAQAFGIELSFGQQATMLLVMMITSKGIAGVPRASLVVVAATAPLFGLPAAGILLIMGIDQLLDMGRTMTNVLGNGLATAAVAKWQGEIESEEVEVEMKLAA